MWEIFSDGEEPYAGVSDLIQFLEVENKRLKKPMGCDEELYELMISCWEADVAKRFLFFLDFFIKFQTHIVRFD